MKKLLVLALVLTGASFAQPGPPAAAPATAAPAPTQAQPAASPPVSPAPETAAASAPAAPSSAAASPGMVADEEYALKMRELEDAVAELKEQIFRSKAKLTLLAEQVQGSTGAGARIVLMHKNELSSNFLVTEVNYQLDGTPLWQETDETGARLTAKKEYPLWDGNIIEGPHTLSVEIVIQGNGTGVFQYLSAYKVRMSDSISFTAEPGKLVTIVVSAHEAGDFTTEMTERPKLRFDKTVHAEVAQKPRATK